MVVMKSVYFFYFSRSAMPTPGSSAGALRSASFDVRQAFDTVRIRSAQVSNSIEQTRLEHSLVKLEKETNRHIRLINKDIRSVLSGWDCTRSTSGYSNRTRPSEKEKQLAQPCFMYGERLDSRRFGMDKKMVSNPTSSGENKIRPKHSPVVN